MEPRSFGKYTLLHRVARGGMADLYLARSAEVAGIERLLVIKLVASRFAADPSFTSMFEDEVRIAASINHPNIGQVIDVGQVQGSYFMAIEYIHGRDLRQVLRRCLDSLGRPVPIPVMVPVAIRICAALHHAHEARGLDGQALEVVHRDVSPSNIMINYDGQVKLVDFGIAKAANRASLTVPGTIKGKLRYLSPEQVLGKPVDRRTDVFGLAVCLWQTTVGKHCFDGASDAQIYEMIVKGQAQPPGRFVPDYPPALERIVMRALSTRPEDRPASAQELQRELEIFATGSGISLSELQLSRFLHERFAPEVAAWEQARQRGKSLLQHLQELTARSEQQGKPVVLVAGSPEASASTPASGPSGPPLQASPSQAATASREQQGPRRTILYGQICTEPAGAQPASTELAVSPQASIEVHPDGKAALVAGSTSLEERRQTVIVGTGLLSPLPEDARPTIMVLGGGAAAAETRSEPASSPDRPELEGRDTVVETAPPAMSGVVVAPAAASAASPASQRRVTRYDPQSAEQRPVRPASAPLTPVASCRPAASQLGPLPAPATRPSPPAEETGALAPSATVAGRVRPASASAPAPVEPTSPTRLAEGPVPLRPDQAPAPIMGRDRRELEERRQQMAELGNQGGEESEASAPRRTITGDWSAQARREPRANTHPYFKDPGTDLHQLVRRRWQIWLFFGIGAAALVGLGLLGWHLSRAPAPARLPEADRGPGRAPGPMAELKSDPAGATVRNRATGIELGRTPLRLALGQGAALELELQLSGYRTQQLRLEGPGLRLVTLAALRAAPDGGARPRPLVTPPAPAKKPTADPKRVKPPRRRVEGDLLDPFD